MTNQEIFDKTVAHLKSQGRAAIKLGTNSSCQYRTSEGLSCAVGVHLTDEEAQLMDTPQPNTGGGTGINATINAKICPERLIPFEALLESLQDAHDSYDNRHPDTGLFVLINLAVDLENIADNFGLEFNKQEFLS